MEKDLRKVAALIAVILPFCFFLLNPIPAFSQIVEPAGGVGSAEGAQLHASAGTMIAAAMETVGYHAQAQILEKLSGSLESAAALIFLGVAFSAILTTAMIGSYQSALWMLVGPSLFFFISGIQVPGLEPVRMNADGAEWRFGAFRDTEDVKSTFINPGGTEASVSMVFHRFNMIVSEGMQLVIKAITNEDISKQMIFTARQRTVEDLFGNNLQDAGSMALASYFMVVCATEVGDARTLAMFKREVESNIRTAAQVRQDPIYNAAKVRYCDRFPRADKQLSKGPWMEFIYKLPENLQFTISQEDNRTRHVSQAQLVSCEDMWRWTVLGTMNETAQSMENWSFRNFPWYSWRIYGTLLWNRSLQNIIEKFVQNEQQNENTLEDPCPMSTNINPFGLQGVSNDQFTVQLLKMSSALMLRKSMTQPPNQLLFERVMNGHHGIAPLEGAGKMLSTAPNSRRAHLERQRASQLAEARRYEAYTFIHLAPYVQGFLLYALALLYPFFALLVLVPGQIGQFITWMALWIWVKSWDIGWALIMVADEVAWELLPKHGYFNPDNEAAFTTPVNLLEGAYAGDPAYSIAGYWMLLASMVMAVPIITGQAVLGSKRAIAGRLFEGMNSVKTWSEGYGDSAMRYIGAQQVGQYTRKSAQDSTLSQAIRGISLTQKTNATNQSVDQQNRSIPQQIGEELINDTQTEQNALDLIRGRANQVQGAVTGDENARQAGNAQVQRARNNIDNEVQRTEPLRRAFNGYAESRIPMLTRVPLIGDRVRRAWYGHNLNNADVNAMASERVFDNVMKQAGLDPAVSIPFVSDPASNEAMNRAYQLQLYRRAHGGYVQTDADLMAIVSAFGFSRLNTMAAGPVGLGYGMLQNANYVSSQHNIGRQIIRDANQLTAQIQLNMHDHHQYESTYSRRFQLASEAESYLSEDRGGEFFAIDVYNPDFNFHLSRSMERSDIDWNFEQSRALGNQVRWTFQPGLMYLDILSGFKPEDK